MPVLPDPVNIDVFKILQYGVSGFAVVLLYLGYRLLNQLINIRAGSSSFKPRLIAVIIFMITSLAFFFGGIFGQHWIGIQENPLIVLITPNSMPDGVDLPTIRRGIEMVRIDNGGAIVKVKSNDQLTLQLESLTNQIIHLQRLIRDVPTIDKSLQR